MESIADGVRVCLPEQIRHLTTFVVREQGDWFEDEIKFLRRYLQPGMRMIDIGANYGMYTLSLAKVVGEEGQVHAFEPASATAEFLETSIRANGFSNITLHRKALSDRVGEATFNLAPNAELNSLNPVRDSRGSETVSLTTLDDWAADNDIEAVDFIKLDAEGEERRIIDGAVRLFGQSSPLIMFELKHAKQVNLPLIQRFRAAGFDIFRMVPGIARLVPFDETQAFDPYLLNLFACKPDLADKLAEQQTLVRRNDLSIAPASLDSDARQRVLAQVEGAAFININELPYAAHCSNHGEWQSGTGGVFEQMLDCYVASKSAQLTAAQRWQMLGLALELSRGLTRGGAGHPGCPIEQAASHARIARDAGEQARAVEILLQAISTNEGVTSLDLKLPFLPAVTRYDRIEPGDRLNRWLVSSVLEQYVRDHAYSTYFTAKKAFPSLQRLRTLGFMNGGMRRRFNLISALKFRD